MANESFLDMLPQVLGQGLAGFVPGGQVAYNLAQTGPVQALASAVQDASRAVPETLGGLTYAPLLNAQQQGVTPAYALGYAHGQAQRQAQEQGLLPTLEAARAAEQAAPEAFPMEKGLLQAPLDPLNYVGGVATRGMRAGAELVGPATTVGKGLLAGAAANDAYAAAVAQTLGLLGAGAKGAYQGTVGRIPGKLAAHFNLEESPWSALQSAGGQATQTQAAATAMAAAGAAPEDAGSLFRWLAGQPARETPGAAGPAAGEATAAVEDAGRAAARAAAGLPTTEAAATAAPTVTEPALAAARSALAPATEAAGVDLARVPDASLKQLLNHGQQDLREAEGLAASLGLPSTPPGQDRPLDTLLQAAQDAAPTLNPQDLLAVAARTAETAGLPRVRSTGRGPGAVAEQVGTVNALETTDDVAKALRLAGAPDEAVRLAQAQFLNDRYGPVFPASPGQPQYNAVAQRLAREGSPGPGAPVPPGETPSPPPVAGAAPDVAAAEAAAEAPAGIPFGRAQIDRNLLQANLDAGMPMAEARAKAVVNVEAGGAPPTPEAAPAPPSPPAVPEGAPPVAGPEAAVSLAGGAPEAAGEAALGAPVPLTGAPAAPPTYTGLDAALAAAARGRAAAGQVTAEDVAAMSKEQIRRRFGVGDAQAARIQAGEPPPGGFAPSADIIAPPAPPAGTAPPPAAPPLMEGTPAALGTEVPPAVSQELAAAKQDWAIINKRSTDPLERIAAQRRLQAAQTAQDDALKAAYDLAANAPPPPPLPPAGPLSGTEVPPAVRQELADALANRQTVLAESTDPNERIAANARVTAAQTAYDDVLKAAAGLPTSTAVPDYVGAATAKAAGQGLSAQQSVLSLAGAQAGATPELLAQMRAAAPGLLQAFAQDLPKAATLMADLARAQPGVAAPESLAGAAEQALALQKGGLVDPTAAKSLVSDARALLTRYGDVNLADPAAEPAALLSAFFQERNTALGNPKPLSIPLVSGFMNLVRGLDLASGKYPLKVIADSLLHQGAIGGRLGIPDLAVNLLRATATGEEAGLGPAAAAGFQARGIVAPAGLYRTDLAAQMAMAANPAEGAVAEGAPTTVRGALGELGGKLKELPGNLLTGQGWKDAGAWLGSVTTALGQTAASTARTAGLFQGYDAAAAQQADALAGRLGTIIGGAEGAAAADAVRAARGIVPPGTLQQWLTDANATPDTARAAFSALADFTAAARDAGLKQADRISVGSSTMTNLDEAVRTAVPFHVFATRSAPRILEMFLTNPWTWKLFDAYYRATAEYDKQEGILPGTALANRVPVLDIGGTKVMLNPTDYFAEARYFAQPFPSPKATPIGNLYQRLEQVGLGLAPWAAKPLEMSGALGPKPPTEVTPLDAELSAVLSAIRGEPTPMPWSQLGNLRLGGPIGVPTGAVAPGEDVYNPNTETNKRLMEMSAERTGQIDNPAYVAALNNPASPLFRDAAREVAVQEIQQMAFRRLGFPIELRRPTEALAQEAMAGLPQVNAAGPPAGRWTMPTFPYPGAVINPLGIPGFGGGLQPPTTFAQRQAMLLDRARTNPYAMLYSQAYSDQGLGGGGGGAESAYSAMRDQVQKQWQSGTESQRQALAQDPRTRGFILDLMIRNSPLFKPPGGLGGGRSILQDVYSVP